MESPIIIKSNPGIKRDGTRLEGDNYVDGQWCRFQRGLPRKIGGFQGLTSTVPEISRGLDSFSRDSVNYLHSGSVSFLTQFRISSGGVFIGQSNRTPGTYSPSPDALWQFDTFANGVTAQASTIAHPGDNLSDIDSTTVKPIFFGLVQDATALVDTGLDPVSGGIVVLGPYLFTYGSDGYLSWTKPNDVTTLDATAFVNAQKIVKGLPLRGGQAGPSGIFWSLDSVIIANFLGGDGTTSPIFSFNTASASSSILSSQGVVEYDGIYYWPGVDRFLSFNGVVRELPNQMNQNWFYDNLNFTQRQKVFGFKVTRFGEIWWCYPRDNATECTHAVIFNVREGSWYDTVLPNGGRSIAVSAKVYNKPFMIDLDLTPDGYSLWQHETGTDRILGNSITAVRSYFETNEINLLTSDQPTSKSLSLSRIEQDFVQSGNMTVTVKGRQNAKADVVSSDPVTFPALSTAASDQTVMFKDIRRLLNFRFESNVAGGNYEMGQCFGHVQPADGRVLT